jgi:hypothetical protein
MMAWDLLDDFCSYVFLMTTSRRSGDMRMMKAWFRRGFVLPAAAVCSLLVPFTAAQAALVNYSFTGSIDGISPALAPVSGSFQFDKTTGGSDGAYNGAVKGFTITIGGALGYSSSFTSGANAVTISQNLPLGSGVVDRWALSTAVTGPELNGTGYTPFNFDLRLDKQGGGLFANSALQDPPSLGAVSAARWRLFFEDVDGNPAVFLGSITSLTAVPLPAAVLLFGAGLISLVGLGAGGLRNLGVSRT